MAIERFDEFLNTAFSSHSKILSGLPDGARWDPSEWTWYEDDPHQRFHGTSLFNGDDFYDDYSPLDGKLEQQFYSEHPGDLFDSHIVFVECVFTAVANHFQNHPLCIQQGISKVPIFLTVPGCPNYGEEYFDIWRAWNPDGLPAESNYN